jgi:hypothetical protein
MRYIKILGHIPGLYFIFKCLDVFCISYLYVCIFSKLCITTSVPVSSVLSYGNHSSAFDVIIFANSDLGYESFMHKTVGMCFLCLSHCYGSLFPQPGKLNVQCSFEEGCMSARKRGQRTGPTFTARDGGAPDHIPILQDAGDRLRSLGFDKSIITVERNRTPKQKPVSKTPPIYRNAGIVTLILTKC